jgi:ABC-2 type transport system permease protein
MQTYISDVIEILVQNNIFVDIIASIALLAAALLLSMWLAGRIFQTGILMYGKRPSIREIFRWLRAR